MNKTYVILAVSYKEPKELYYCGKNNAGGPIFHHALEMVKQMPLQEAEEIFNDIPDVLDKSTVFCLIEWETFLKLGVGHPLVTAYSVKIK